MPQIPDALLEEAEDILLTLEHQRSRPGKRRTIARALMRAGEMGVDKQAQATVERRFTVIDGGYDG